MKVTRLTNIYRFATAVLLTLSGVLTALASDYPTTVGNLNPVAYYRLGETAVVPVASTFTNLGTSGASQNGYIRYPGSLAAEDPAVAGVAGVVGTAVAFTNPAAGANLDFASFIDSPFNQQFSPPSGSPFSIECWVKPNGHANDLVGILCSLNSAQSRSGWVLYQNTAGTAPGDGTPSFEFRTGGLASYAGTIDTGHNTAQPGVWAHLVATFDGLNMALYLNGVLAAGPTPANLGAGYNPNIAQPFRIGGTTFPNRGFDGTIDEVVFYTNVLSAGTIAAHYDAAKPTGGTNNTPAGYSAQILASNPFLYLPLNEPTYTVPTQASLPTTADAGTLGAAVQGTNQPGMTAAAAGPPFSGFPSPNYGASYNGVVGNVNIGNPDGLNFTGAVTMVTWIKPVNAAGGVVQNILAHGYRAYTSSSGQEVFLRINGTDYGVGSSVKAVNNLTPTEGANTTGGRAALDAAGNAWVFLAASFDGTTWRLYRYDQLVASGAGTMGALFMDPADDTNGLPAYWSIGSRSDFTEDFFDTAMDRPFQGSIDEVAIFTNALSTAQIQSIFYSAKMSPIFISRPIAPTPPIYEGPSYSFSVEAAGNPTLLYQWQKNGTNLPGQTTTGLALNNVTTNDTGTYAIIVTNDYGSITSSFSMTVLAGPPLFTSQPVSITRFAGALANFTSTTVGSPPITYQWYYNTNTSIAGATTTSYTINAVQASDAGKYNLRAFNPYSVSGTNSSFATLNVSNVPANPYPAAVLADNPLAFWRLDEASGTVALDKWGGHDGTYSGGVVLGQSGYSPLDSDKAAGFGAVGRYVGGILGLDFSGNGSPFTPFSLEAWVNGPALQPGGDTGIGATIISKGRGGNGAGGQNGLQYVLDVTGGVYRFHVEASSGSPSTGDATADIGPNGTWQHVVGTLDASGNMIIYVNGQNRGVGAAPPNGLLTTALKTIIGNGQGGVTPNINAYFTGTIDEVAVYGVALTPTQVHTHYCGQYGASQTPLVLIGPSPTTNWINWPITLRAVIAGSCDLGYQWYHGTTPLTDGGTVVGATSNILTITALAISDRGNYFVSNYNSVGNSNSAAVYVDVLDTPVKDLPLKDLVMHLKFNNNLLDSTGRGNDGTGKHTTLSGTATVLPGPANGGLFEYVSGGNIPANGQNFLLKGIHYSSDTGVAPQLGGNSTTGTNDYYVALGTRPDLKFSSNVDYSVSYWVRLPNGYDLGDLPFFCDATNSTGGKGFTFATSYGSNGVFAAGTEAASGSWAWSLNATRIEGPWYAINDALWHNLVHSYTRTGNGVTYLDGVQVDSRSVATAGDMNQAAQACIGQDPTGAYAENGSGDIADLGVWRRALTELQARGIYVAGTNGFSFADITPTITLGPGANQVTVKWQTGTLQQAGAASGPYLDTAFTSPYTFTPVGASFFRVRQ